MLKFRSVNSIVIAPANTGNASRRRIAVTITDHANSGNLCKVIPGFRILRIVVIKFIAPNIDEIPDRWRLKIARSTDPPECDWMLDRGG